MSVHPKPHPDAASVLHRENILVLDIFFEALNYETIEQKKAYEVAGLLGECSGSVAVLGAPWQHPAGILQQGGLMLAPCTTALFPRHRHVPTAWMQSGAPRHHGQAPVAAAMSSAPPRVPDLNPTDGFPLLCR